MATSKYKNALEEIDAYIDSRYEASPLPTELTQIKGILSNALGADEVDSYIVPDPTADDTLTEPVIDSHTDIHKVDTPTELPEGSEKA